MDSGLLLKWRTDMWIAIGLVGYIVLPYALKVVGLD